MASSNDYLSRSQLARRSFATGLIAAVLCCAHATAQDDGATTAAEQHSDKVARPKDRAALFQAFAKIRGLSASYREEKHISLLRVPLKSHGKLYFLAPGYLSRLVEKPKKSTLTITETELRMADDTGTEVIDLRQSDRVRLFVTSLMRVFQGDEQALQKNYDVVYVLEPKSDTGWRLELTPKTKPLDQILKQLVLHGDRNQVTRIERFAPNGDRTVTKTVKVDVARTFTAEEKQTIFGIDAKRAEQAPEKATKK